MSLGHKKNWEKDVSSAGSQREDENMRNNTVITGRETDKAFVRNKKSSSEGKSFQPQRLYLGHGLGIQGLMRSFIGQNTFTGSWEEDLDSTISVYKTMSTICQLNEDKNIKAIPIMLSEYVFLYYSSHVMKYQTYGDATNTLCLWYKNADKKRYYQYGSLYVLQKS